jgi:hypothetical protein
VDVGQWEIFVPALVLAQNEYSRSTQDWVIALSLPAAFADINIRKSWSVVLIVRLQFVLGENPDCTVCSLV